MQNRTGPDTGMYSVHGKQVEVSAIEVFVLHVDGMFIASFLHREDIVARSETSAELAVGRLLTSCPEDVPPGKAVIVYGLGTAISDLERTFRRHEIVPEEAGT